MAFVRCHACAAKVLTVASTCPVCRVELPAGNRSTGGSACAHCKTRIPLNAVRCPWCAGPQPVLYRVASVGAMLVSALLRMFPGGAPRRPGM
jgi:predicted amidophosphoribosyltransferase